MAVLDAGCGTGILGLWAARQGASRVVAVDRTDVEVAESLARDNGLEHVLTVLQKDLYDLDTKDCGGPVDVLVAFVYYNDPRRDETQSDLVVHLSERLLRPGGICIPNRVRYHVTPLHWPEQDITAVDRNQQRNREELSSNYGLRFETLFEHLRKGPPPASWFPRRDSDGSVLREGSRDLAAAVPVFEVNYGTLSPSYPETVILEAQGKGILTCVLWRQELCFEDRVLFANESISWVNEPVAVTPGTRVAIALNDQWRLTNRLTATPIL
jgi:SAM-dependent methyltransferase